MPEENSTAPQFPMTQIQFTPDGSLVIQDLLAPGTTLTKSIGPDLTRHIVRGYLERHPEFLQELAKESLEAKKRELQLIRHISSSRND